VPAGGSVPQHGIDIIARLAREDPIDRRLPARCGSTDPPLLLLLERLHGVRDHSIGEPERECRNPGERRGSVGLLDAGCQLGSPLKDDLLPDAVRAQNIGERCARLGERPGERDGGVRSGDPLRTPEAQEACELSQEGLDPPLGQHLVLGRDEQLGDLPVDRRGDHGGVRVDGAVEILGELLFKRRHGTRLCTLHHWESKSDLDPQRRGAHHLPMTRKTQLVCVWLAPLGLVLLAAGFFPIARYFPVPTPSASAGKIAHFYQSHTTATRLGLLVGFIGLAGYGPFIAVLTRQMLRINPPRNPMALLQMISGTTAWLFLAGPLLVLSVAAFRPDRPAATTQALHDLGWFLFIMPFMPFVVQNICIGVAVMQDKATHPVFPRWVAYFNFWIAVLFLPGGLLTFFKTGPFAYNGVLAFWIPVAIFCVWMLVMPWATHRAIDSEPESP
jgi:hypothetical protein